MIALLLLILFGPFLAVAPVVAAVAPQIPGFWGRRPARTRRTPSYRLAASWA